MWRSLAIYCRVSTGDQTLEQQEAALRAWVADRAGQITVFPEKRSSRRERPIQNDLLRRARSGEFDAIACWKFDRWSRSARELVMWLDEAQRLKIDFLSLTEALDTSTHMGRAVFQILAAVAELERAMIAERTKAKLDHLRAKGVRLGRPRVHIDIDRARRLVTENKLTVRQLARAIGVSSGTAAKVRTAVLQRDS